MCPEQMELSVLATPVRGSVLGQSVGAPGCARVLSSAVYIAAGNLALNTQRHPATPDLHKLVRFLQCYLFYITKRDINYNQGYSL